MAGVLQYGELETRGGMMDRFSISRLINYQENFWELPSVLMIKKDTSSQVKRRIT